MKYFNRHEPLLVANTLFYVDEYLYKNCDIEVVRKYLDEMYEDEDFILDNTEVRNPSQKVVCIKKGRTASNFPSAVYNSATNKKSRMYLVSIHEKNGTHYKMPQKFRQFEAIIDAN